jgi:hypothetical protein
MRKGRIITVLEVALGLLPATVVLLPLLMAGAGGSAIAVLAILADGSKPFSMRLTMALPPVGIVLWVLSAALGMLALWVSVLGRETVTQQPRLRIGLVACLLGGSVAALLWLYVMGTGRGSQGLLSWAIWIGLLGGPLIVSTRHLILLVMNQRTPARQAAAPPPKSADDR